MEPGELIGDPVAINSSSMKIGRCAPAEVILPHKSVSREHCIIGLANDELFVTDQNSTNGTYIDGVRITRATILPVGSILKVGEVSLRHAVRTDATVQPQSQFRPMAGQPLQAGRFAAAS
jgi:pSer/pThr/pTyr-binding forkhead associated (FHA) protein